MPLVGLEPGPFDPESSALTTGPLTPLERERILLFTRGGRVIQARGFSVADKKTSQKREV